jgi:hypothetical protein
VDAPNTWTISDDVGRCGITHQRRRWLADQIENHARQFGRKALMVSASVMSGMSSPLATQTAASGSYSARIRTIMGSPLNGGVGMMMAATNGAGTPGRAVLERQLDL